MKKILILLFSLPIIGYSQKSAISIKVGYTNSSVDNYPNRIGYNPETVNTTPISFIELGTGYTYNDPEKSSYFNSTKEQKPGKYFDFSYFLHTFVKCLPNQHCTPKSLYAGK